MLSGSLVKVNSMQSEMFPIKILDQFLSSIWQGYAAYNVSYHNDIHGLDVAQMSFIILEAGLKEKASL